MAAEVKKGNFRVGGIAFFSSLLLLGYVVLVNFNSLINILDVNAYKNWRIFIAGCLIGFVLCKHLIVGHPAVFLHELKHSILSNLAGNKAKSLKVKKSSGHFEYSYTQRTAAYNAFISLAPYFLPVFTLPCLLAAILIFSSQPYIMIFIVALAYGADLSLCTRDIGPHQSDIFLIRGGYLIGMSYILLINLALFSLLAFWVTNGFAGIIYLAEQWLLIGANLYNSLRATLIKSSF